MYLYCSSCVCYVLSFFSLVFLSHFITHWLLFGALLLFLFSSILSCRFVFILWFFMFLFFRHFLSDSWYRFCHSLCPSFLLLCLLGCFCGHVCVSFWLLVIALMSYCYSSLLVYIPFFPLTLCFPKSPMSPLLNALPLPKGLGSMIPSLHKHQVPLLPFPSLIDSLLQTTSGLARGNSWLWWYKSLLMSMWSSTSIWPLFSEI